MHREKEQLLSSLSKKRSKFSFLNHVSISSYITILTASSAFIIYMMILLFGDNSYIAYVNIKSKNQQLQQENKQLKQENAQLQKDYFELLQLQE